ncbi:TPA: hypothetical protein DCZ46_01395 [Candidatus Campbellbacteria bacterium]|nr:MAG: seg [Candidatus Campbellbacteria bacterium GW2011_OD1_34_28]KKP75261.1 MAG: hypothetical protein UR74_C0001G0117 [Candidatus Campbellbacteria bacterium GW2011_GWD2_35_24]KKP76178.1 MAG: hypothetical protein UR75_C0001G0212 [Candidatus Campbellbacteria bacterium GW2011_GWC2_35_28]KKP77367.1 MAG: hypothetical protein UR76_C0001G0212 [Candidatus Campbellbacteria bacterium GW2011_GWC1_35_31]KKP79296.1 MAG: hypothetical protein UR79_C0001G0212 [Candidatus Campbellbacteria bacterium GW2011_GW
MTLKGVNDEQRGKLYKRFQAIVERTGEGKSLDFDFVMNKLQIIHDGVDLFDPHKFFVTRRGLEISRYFRGSILSVAKKIAILPSDETDHYSILKSMKDTEIRKIIGEKCVYEDASKFCFALANMINKQPKGEEGILLIDGNVNIFYVRGKNGVVFVVYVYWRVVAMRWAAACDLFDCGCWSAKCRVLYKRLLTK